LIRIPLRTRIALAVFLLAGTMAVVLLWQVQATEERAAEAQQQAAEALIGDLLEEVGRLAVVRSEYSELDHLFGRIRQNRRVRTIVVADADRRVVASTDAALLGKALPPLRDGEATAWRTRDLVNAAGSQGMLAMEFSGAELLRARTRARRWSGGVALASVTLVALVSVLMATALTRRLASLEKASMRIADGDYGYRTGLQGTDEVSALGRTLDAMAARIQASVGELRASREQYRLLLETIPHGIQENDTTGIITFSNRAHHRILGCAEGELVGRAIWDLQGSPEEREALRRYLAVLVAERPRPVPYLTQSRRKDGQLVDLQIDWDYQLDASGRLSGFISVITDISERKRAQARASHVSRLYALLSNVNQTIVRVRNRQALLDQICRIAVEQGGFRMAWIGLVDAEGTKVRVVAREGHVGAYVDRLAMPLTDGPEARGPTATAVRTGRRDVSNDIGQDERMAPWREQALVHGYRSSASFPLTVLGRTIGAINVYSGEVGFFDQEELDLLDELATDIAFALESIEREEALRRSEEQYRLVVENASEAIFIAQDGRLKFPNAALLSMLRRPAEEIAARPFTEFVVPEDREMVADRHRRRLQGLEVPRVYEFRITNSAGEVRWGQISAVRIEWEGRPATLNFITDVTERKGLELQLLHAQKMEAVGRLAGGIAHDFNNVLAAIIGYGNVALAELPAVNPVRDDVEQMLVAAGRAADLTKSLLAFSRRQVNHPQPVTLDAVVARVEGLLRRALGEDVALRMALNAPETVLADSGQIEQLLLNLATNARDAMPHGGQLTVETRRSRIDDEFIQRHGYGRRGDYVLLSVSDTGEGMDEATRQRVFEPFFTTKEVGKGTGLGLAMAYGIVKQHEGYIAADSAPGQGATFRIYLPAVSGPAHAAATAQAEAEPRGGKETILLAEDDPAVRSLATRVLEGSGYTVIAARDGQQAVEQLQRHGDRIDLLVVDVVMPGKNGREVVEQARRSHPGVRVIFTSGYPSDMLQVKTVLEEGLSFLPKPASPRDLLRTVREVLDR